MNGQEAAETGPRPKPEHAAGVERWISGNVMSRKVGWRVGWSGK